MTGAIRRRRNGPQSRNWARRSGSASGPTNADQDRTVESSVHRPATRRCRRRVRAGPRAGTWGGAAGARLNGRTSEAPGPTVRRAPSHADGARTGVGAEHRPQNRAMQPFGWDQMGESGGQIGGAGRRSRHHGEVDETGGAPLDDVGERLDRRQRRPSIAGAHKHPVLDGDERTVLQPTGDRCWTRPTRPSGCAACRVSRMAKRQTSAGGSLGGAGGQVVERGALPGPPRRIEHLQAKRHRDRPRVDHLHRGVPPSRSPASTAAWWAADNSPDMVRTRIPAAPEAPQRLKAGRELGGA